MRTYRMHRGTMMQTGPDSGFFGKESKPTQLMFTGRNHKAAQKKMDKFIREAQVTGSFHLVEATQ